MFRGIIKSSDLSKAMQRLKDVRTVGITSGASVPDVLVTEVIDHIKRVVNGMVAVEELEILKEEVQFSLPKEVQTVTASVR